MRDFSGWGKTTAQQKGQKRTWQIHQGPTCVRNLGKSLQLGNSSLVSPHSARRRPWSQNQLHEKERKLLGGECRRVCRFDCWFQFETTQVMSLSYFESMMMLYLQSQERYLHMQYLEHLYTYIIYQLFKRLRMQNPVCRCVM